MLYLGICNDAEARLVSLPFERHRFLRRMAVPRCDAAAKDADKLPGLREMGVEMAKALGAILRVVLTAGIARRTLVGGREIACLGHSGLRCAARAPG